MAGSNSPIVLRSAVNRGCELASSDPAYKEGRDYINAACYYLRRHATFFAHLLNDYTVKFTQNAKVCPTSMVNRNRKITFNVDFLRKKTEEGGVGYVAFLVAHEMLHPLKLLFQRMKGHNPTWANIADDYIINQMLKDDFGFVPPDALYAPEKFGGLTYEQAYQIVAGEQKLKDKLRNQPPMKDEGGGGGEASPGGDTDSTPSQNPTSNDPGKTGEDGEQEDKGEGAPSRGGGDKHFDEPDSQAPTIDLDLGSDEDREAADTKANRALEFDEACRSVSKAYAAAKEAGAVSAGIQRLFNEVRQSRVEWQSLMESKISAHGQMLALNSSPHRRYLDMGLYVPSEVETGFDVVVAVDTSVSVSPEQLEVAVAETAAIIRLCGGTARVLNCDAEICGDGDVSEAELRENLKGGGGTAFGPVFRRLESEPPQLLVFITDSYAGDLHSLSEPEYPVIFAVYNKDVTAAQNNLPFGEIVPIPDDYGAPGNPSILGRVVQRTQAPGKSNGRSP